MTYRQARRCKGRAGNAKWVNEFIPLVKDGGKRVAEALLWLCHNLGLCCAIVGEFAMYLVVMYGRHVIYSLYTWPTHRKNCLLKFQFYYKHSVPVRFLLVA